MTLKQPVLRDRKWLDELRTRRCVITGEYGNANETVDPMHLGTLGKGIKAPDNEALPVIHRLHAIAHQKGEITMLRLDAPADLVRAAFRALAREMYAEWKAKHGKA